MSKRRPGVLRWLISCDESGIDGKRHYGFGSLWMPYQRRGDFQADIRALRKRHRFADEVKWKKVRKARLTLHEELVDYFFDTEWLAFHCLIVRKADVDKAKHGGDYDLARRKHFTMLLTNKIERTLKKRPHRDQTFRVWVDPIASRYAKADEAVHAIGNNVLRRRAAAEALRKDLARSTRPPIAGVHEHDSKKTPQIQLCDLLLGAVMDGWQKDQAQEPGKVGVKAHIANRLGWPDLLADTKPEVGKFNIWYFTDRPRERSVKTRPVPF